MATIVLSAVGAAIGGSVGGTVAGLSSVIVGRAVGATLGNVIDQRLLGAGAAPVQAGKVDRFRLNGAGDGAPVADVYGRMRVGGQVIWASDFLETTTVTGGGKGAPATPKTTEFSYSVSLAVAVCGGEITSISRVWADGEEVALNDLNMRVYEGGADQLPDPAIEAIEGAGMVPAYRGTAYVVMENLALAPFGNRVPQFSFEVVRPEQPEAAEYASDLPRAVQGVAMMPGTGEYALAPTPVYYSSGPGAQWAANINSPSGQSDFATSVAALGRELPACKSVSLVVSWFGSDLRCDSCTVTPKVERRDVEGANMPWGVAGETRATAGEIAKVDGSPIYGGTPSDASVMAAIRHLRDAGQQVMFYPFILMDQQAGNGLSDPWSDAPDQPALPWRGRITLSVAPGRAGSPDGTASADAEVAAFFGTATAADFIVATDNVSYAGPAEWGLRRFVLHNAALCAAAGGVEAFCIGSEMRALTQIRGAGGVFAAVQQMRALAGEVRAILGAGARIGYAADWSEYFGYQPEDGSGDRYFHLDPLWSDANVDFVGIDNYMPLSDWREGTDHADAGWGAIYNPDYLRANIEGGEGYDWYYASPEAEAAQIRTDIADPAHGEDWIWRYKDIRNWWLNEHHERIGGVRQAGATDWVAQSKPVWFTEIGCAAIDKGSNEPNRFLDPKSSESGLPRASTGARDDLIQMQFLRTVLSYWADPANNPVSEVYGAAMIDTAKTHVWAWDARPFPAFPNNRDLWADGGNYARGHWINGRVGARSLASVVAEICRKSGLGEVDTSELYGYVRGYAVEQVAEARAALQPLMLRYGFDAVERDGVLKFIPRDGMRDQALDTDLLAETGEVEAGNLEQVREPEAELSGRVRVKFVQADADFEVISEEAVLPDEATHAVSTSEMSLSMTRGEGRAVAERWLAEARVARETLRFALPPSQLSVRAGDVVRLPADAGEGDGLFRVDRVEVAEAQQIEAVRIDPGVYRPSELPDDTPGVSAFVPPLPVLGLFMDLPLMAGDEVAHAPHLAVTADPWPGSAALYSAPTDQNYALSRIIAARSVIGVTETPMNAADIGLWDRGAPLQVKLIHGGLETRTEAEVLNGANLAAIGDGSSGLWELFQFSGADLIAPDTWWLSGRLRGQQGSDGVMPPLWPAGSWFVLLNGVPQQIDLKPTQLRIARHYRIGPANRAYDDPSYTHLVEAFDGIGLRPYSPSHLRAERRGSGDIALSWIRRTRIDGDSWDLPEVPLGEESESYAIRVRQGSAVLSEASVGSPQWTYSAAAQAADGVGPGAVLEVAQVSARVGPGPFVSVAVPV